MSEGKYQNEIDQLDDLEQYRYENIFKLFQTGDNNFFYYNILNKIKLPDNLNERLFDKIKFPQGLPLTTLSYNVYGTTYLWWLILVTNNISNPFDIVPGQEIRILKKAYVKPVLDSITQQQQ